MSSDPLSVPGTSRSARIPFLFPFHIFHRATAAYAHPTEAITAVDFDDVNDIELLDVGAIWKAVRSGVWYPCGWGGIETASQPIDDNAIARVQNTTTFVAKRLDKLQRESVASPPGNVVLADFAGRRIKTHIHCCSISELRCILAALQSLSSPWRKLPDELLIGVFSWCVPSNTVFSTSEAPLLLTKICSRWHALSINTPSLWTSLTLAENFLIYKEAHLRVATDFEARWQRETFGLGSMGSEFISTILHRSRPLPISLASHVGVLLQEDARNLFYENISRLRNLALLVPELGGRYKGPIPTADQPFATPFLETLDIYAPRLHAPPPHQGGNWATLYLNLIHSSAPTLRRLTIYVSHGPKADFNQDWCNLTHITWGTGIPKGQIINLFHSAPNLTYASLPGVLPGYYDPSSGSGLGANPVVMAKLETLVVGACNMEGVFSAITAPNLLHLVQLSPSNRNKHAMLSFLQRSAFRLETLYLYYAKYDSHADLLDILQSVEGGGGSTASDENQAQKRMGHLKALLVTDGLHGRRLLSDEILDKLTWRQDAKQIAGDRPRSDMVVFQQGKPNTAHLEELYHNRSGADVLFSGLEYLSLYGIELPSLGQLPEMLRSRTASSIYQSNNEELSQASASIAKLKVFETWHPTSSTNDVSGVDWAEAETLRARGLVFRLFKLNDLGSCMSNGEKVLLRRYIQEEGLVVRDFLHDTGLFAPIALDEETRIIDNVEPTVYHWFTGSS